VARRSDDLMSKSESLGVDRDSPPFDQFSSLHWLASNRRGRDSMDHARHHLYVGRHRQRRVSLLVKVTARPGIVYEENLVNEIATLTTINRELPESPYFPFLEEQGRLADGRLYLTMSLFDELPLAASIGPERLPHRLVAHVRAAFEVAAALMELHRLRIFHVDLNPMNILYRTERERPIIRIVDFESSYEVARHGAGTFYNPPTSPAFTAPEIPGKTPDARSDLYSLGAVLYTMRAGFHWTWAGDVRAAVAADGELDSELKSILLRAVDLQPDRRYASVADFQVALGGYLARVFRLRTS
jgi:serine/threonine protein kinase